MLRELNSYAGLFAKVKVMERNLLDKKDYSILLTKQSVSDVASYLKDTTGYKSAFSGVDTLKIHRGQLEQLLQKSREQELVKLIGFLPDGDKRFLETFITKWEINLIKETLRQIVNESAVKSEISVNPFLEKMYSFDPYSLIKCDNTKDFENCLKDTDYYEIISSSVSDTGQIDVFRAEMMMDVYYYRLQWNAIKKYVPKSDRDSLRKAVGSNIDMLNILWILRAKNYFDIPSGLIIAYIIPEHYRIKKETLIQMASADKNTVETYLQDTPYEKLTLNDDFYAEKTYSETILSIVKRQAGNNPFSVMSAVSYIYKKDAEIGNIIKITEGIRYKVDKTRISDFLTGTGGEINGG